MLGTLQHDDDNRVLDPNRPLPDLPGALQNTNAVKPIQPETSTFGFRLPGASEGLAIRTSSRLRAFCLCMASCTPIWEFPNIRGTLFWVLMIRILLFKVLH